ncbi:hypothetical protein NUW54_g13693 [Trametes sanguinea]|uniref:Uncharacterized protein n=1 Tax=Trametes sanguinea TaxID=158606 RepID=A0ACC1MJK4_9APHY|nr:hypothetical protein NUW54_g13693 [Trametes sanguinea]
MRKGIYADGEAPRTRPSSTAGDADEEPKMPERDRSDPIKRAMGPRACCCDTPSLSLSLRALLLSLAFPQLGLVLFCPLPVYVSALATPTSYLHPIRPPSGPYYPILPSPRRRAVLGYVPVRHLIPPPYSSVLLLSVLSLSPCPLTSAIYIHTHTLEAPLSEPLILICYLPIATYTYAYVSRRPVTFHVDTNRSYALPQAVGLGSPVCWL